MNDNMNGYDKNDLRELRSQTRKRGETALKTLCVYFLIGVKLITIFKDGKSVLSLLFNLDLNFVQCISEKSVHCDFITLVNCKYVNIF